MRWPVELGVFCFGGSDYFRTGWAFCVCSCVGVPCVGYEDMVGSYGGVTLGTVAD